MKLDQTALQNARLAVKQAAFNDRLGDISSLADVATDAYAATILTANPRNKKSAALRGALQDLDLTNTDDLAFLAGYLLAGLESRGFTITPVLPIEATVSGQTA